MTDRYMMSRDGRFVFNAEDIHDREQFRHFRPVAVIDPADTEAVRRLVGHDAFLGPLVGDTDVKAMQAALREFAAPTPPRPEEPTGLGAVVEDEAGGRWVRTEAHYPWTHTYFTDDGDECGVDCDYADLNVVRVLSEGVTA